MRHARIVVILGLVSCSSDNSEATSTVDPTKSCEAAADAIGKVAARCGGDYKAAHDAYVKAFGSDGCTSVKRVRDETALRSTCLPSIEALTCDNYNASRLDSTCKDQFSQ